MSSLAIGDGSNVRSTEKICANPSFVEWKGEIFKV